MDDSLLNQNLEDLIDTLQDLSKKFDKSLSNRRNYTVRSGNLADNSKSGIDYKKHFNNVANFAKNGLKKAPEAVANSLTRLAGSSNDLLHAFKEMAGVFILGRVFNDLIDGGIDLTKSYNNLTNIGQQFGGSLTQMSIQAAKAGVPLETFAELLQRQSTAAAVMNNLGPNNGMGLFAAQVRANLQPMGFYGMTVEQLNDVTADYLETLRKQNLLTIQNRLTNQQSVTQFAASISQFSTVTGVARDKIEQTATEALNNTALQEMNLSPTQMKNISIATAGLASLPGDTGQALSNALTQTIGMGGARFSDLGKELYAAGQGQIVQYLQNYANKVQSGTATKSDLATFVRELQQSNLSNSQFIRAQIMAGNQSVAQVGELLTNLNGINAADFTKENAAAQGLAKFFNTLQNTLFKLETDFSLGFYSVIKGIDGKLGDFGNVIDSKIGPLMNFFGQIAGTFITNIYNLLTSAASQQWFKNFGELIQTRITPKALKEDFQEIQHVIKVIADFFKSLVPVFNWVSKSLIPMATWAINHPITSLAIAGAAYVATKFLPNMVALMRVNAAVVNISGKGIGGLFDNLKKKTGRIGGLAKDAETAGEDIAGGAKKGGLLSKLSKLTKLGKLGGLIDLGGEAAGGAAIGDIAAGVGASILGVLGSPVFLGLAATAAVVGGGYLLYKQYHKTPQKHITPYSTIKNENLAQLKTQYASVQQQIIEEQKLANEYRGNGKMQAVTMAKIAELLKEQNDLQKAIGTTTIQNQKKQENISKQTVQSIKRIP